MEWEKILSKIKLRLLSNSGLSLVEVIVASFCFMIAVIPIMSIFSLSMENSNTIFARTITYTRAQEIVDQLQTIPEDAFTTKQDYTLPIISGYFLLNPNDKRSALVLSDLPKGYSRTLSIKKSTSTEPGKVEVTLSTFSKLRANITLKSTWHSQMIGGGK